MRRLWNTGFSLAGQAPTKYAQIETASSAKNQAPSDWIKPFMTAQL
jgi:hypothetical protein